MTDKETYKAMLISADIEFDEDYDTITVDNDHNDVYIVFTFDAKGKLTHIGAYE